MGIRMLRLAVTVCAVAALSAAARVEAQSPRDSARVMLYLALGGGGETELDTDPGSALEGAADNEASVGVGARLETPLGDFMALGFMAELLSYELDNGSDRHLSGHFDLWLKGRYVFDLGSDVDLEAYLGLPVGFSVVGMEEIAALDREDRSLGWNIGALLGAQLFFTDRFGVMAELGWRRVQVYNQGTLVVDFEATTRTNQFACNVGGVVLF